MLVRMNVRVCGALLCVCGGEGGALLCVCRQP